ncbi:secreted protein, putative [Ixodes scapularis]|uniref:Secreted protein, putative n=1 Tax=Ixodes scapularis TaxID=6945 RepID=B7QJV2_IXOSC|nr:secreted protein, putative [Ixodes scapularis]|eukprot:XP_002415459.1 secreted protein, putative [Ixodes scapularis]
MKAKIFAFFQIAVFIAFGIHLISAGQDTDGDEESEKYELFTVEYCGTNLENGSWTPCTGNNGTCRCFHESYKKVGLCLSTEYTDFNDYPYPNSEEIKAASPLP